MESGHTNMPWDAWSGCFRYTPIFVKIWDNKNFLSLVRFEPATSTWQGEILNLFGYTVKTIKVRLETKIFPENRGSSGHFAIFHNFLRLFTATGCPVENLLFSPSFLTIPQERLKRLHWNWYQKMRLVKTDFLMYVTSMSVDWLKGYTDMFLPLPGIWYWKKCPSQLWAPPSATIFEIGTSPLDGS